MKDNKKKSAVWYGTRSFITVFTKAYKTTEGRYFWLKGYEVTGEDYLRRSLAVCTVQPILLG